MDWFLYDRNLRHERVNNKNSRTTDSQEDIQPINPFYATDLFLYPLKTSENQRFSWGIKRDQWHEMDYSCVCITNFEHVIVYYEDLKVDRVAFTRYLRIVPKSLF